MTTTTIEKEETTIAKSKNYYVRAGMSKVAKIQLPEEVTNNFSKLAESNLKTIRNDYIVALMQKGWTAVSVAKSAGLSNQMISDIVKKHKAEEVPVTLVVPEVPRHEPKTEVVWNLPSPEVLERLLELQPLAKQVRANSPRYRKEAEEYTYLINYAHTVQNVSMYRLSQLLGVTNLAIVSRLVRYGYRTTEGKSKVYTKMKESNRKK